MSTWRLCFVAFFLIISRNLCNAESGKYEIPPVTFQAFEPSGFRVSLPSEDGVQLFGFHGNLNREIEPGEPGNFSGDVTVKNNSSMGMSYYNPDQVLKKGDVIHYWLYVQHNMLRYVLENQTWTVPDLSLLKCRGTVTVTSPQISLCSDSSLLEDNFDQNIIDLDKWMIEQYIPDYPDYEFVVYKKDEDVIFAKNDMLNIKPKLITDERELKKKVLNLTDGCSRKEEIFCKRGLYRMHNPIVSGRLVSKLAFSCANVEIRARLPAGDWIYPEIYLEDDNNQKLFIAYSRGNKNLTDSKGVDIGGRLLFGGPLMGPYEPERSRNLSSLSRSTPFSDDFHIYRLKWTPSEITFFVDNEEYGKIWNTHAIEVDHFVKNRKQVNLVLGLGVGGVTDFPDGYKSGEYEKPWINKNSAQLTSFWRHRQDWYDGTWNKHSQLQVDYVRITSV